MVTLLVLNGKPEVFTSSLSFGMTWTPNAASQEEKDAEISAQVV